MTTVMTPRQFADYMPHNALISTIESVWGLDQRPETDLVLFVCYDALVELIGQEETGELVARYIGTTGETELYMHWSNYKED